MDFSSYHLIIIPIRYPFVHLAFCNMAPVGEYDHRCPLRINQLLYFDFYDLIYIISTMLHPWDIEVIWLIPTPSYAV